LLGQENFKNNSVEPCDVAIRRFLGLFDLPLGVDIYGVDLLKELYKKELITKVRALDILHPSRSWSRKMNSALKHYCQFQIENSERNDDSHSTFKIGSLKNKLRGWGKKSSEEHRIACMARKRVDADRIEKFAPDDVMKNAAIRAYRDLLAIHGKNSGKAVISKIDLRRASVALAGAIFTCSWAGRDGEWKVMTRSHVWKQLHSHKDFLVCPRHKLADKMGEAVKHMYPGLQTAFRLYMELPRLAPNEAPAPSEKVTAELKKIGVDVKDLLFTPVKGSSGLVSFSSLLQTFGTRYLPNTQAPGVNLMRKKFHKSCIMTFQKTDILKDIEIADKHASKTALQHYLCLTQQEQGDTSARIYRKAMGEPPDFPTAVLELPAPPAPSQPSSSSAAAQQQLQDNDDDEPSTDGSDGDTNDAATSADAPSDTDAPDERFEEDNLEEDLDAIDFEVVDENMDVDAEEPPKL